MSITMISPPHNVTVLSPIPSGSLQVVSQVRWDFATWIGDSAILSYMVPLTQTDPTQVVAAILNPATRLMDTELVNQLPDRYPEGSIAFSPDMTRVVYVAEQDGHFNLILWNVEHRKEIWRRDELQNQAITQGAHSFARPITWSRDSGAFAFVDNRADKGFKDALFIADREGGHVVQTDVPQRDNNASGLSWSPDDRYIAAFASMSADPSRNAVTIYEASTGAAVRACSLQPGTDPIAGIASYSLFWSPDNKFVALNMGAEVPGADQTFVAYERETGSVVPILSRPGTQLVGWTERGVWLP